MNLWRWLGVSLFVLGALCLVTTAKLPVYAAQDKKDEGKKDEAKKDAGKKDETKKDEGKKDEQKQEQTFMIQWTPLDMDKDNNYVVKQKIVGVKMKIDIGGNNIAYDSTAKNPKNPMT